MPDLNALQVPVSLQPCSSTRAGSHRRKAITLRFAKKNHIVFKNFLTIIMELKESNGVLGRPVTPITL